MTTRLKTLSSSGTKQKIGSLGEIQFKRISPDSRTALKKLDPEKIQIMDQMKHFDLSKYELTPNIKEDITSVINMLKHVKVEPDVSSDDLIKWNPGNFNDKDIQIIKQIIKDNRPSKAISGSTNMIEMIREDQNKFELERLKAELKKLEEETDRGVFRDLDTIPDLYLNVKANEIIFLGKDKDETKNSITIQVSSE